MKRIRLVLIGLGVVAVVIVIISILRKDVGSPRFFKDQASYYESLRALSRCPMGGSDVGEVYETIKGIPSGNEQEWFYAWERTAERIEKRAERLQDPVSRGLAYFRAHNYHRTAEFFLLPNDPKRPKSYSKCVADFYKGLDSLKVRYEIIEIPYQGRSLKAIYYPGPPGSERKPLIVAAPGFDGIQEEVYFTVAAAAIRRGYSVLTFDGPGQGSALRKYDLKFTPEWERPVKAVLDTFPKTHEQPNGIVLFGSSFGGYLAPRAAAFDDRIDGVVAYDVFFDFQEVFLNRIPSALRGMMQYLLENRRDSIVALLIRMRSTIDPSLRWGLANLRWTMGDGEPAELYSRLAAYSLKDVAKRIRCHVLVFAGENDHFIPSKQVKDFRNALINAKSVTTFVYSEETGGDQHCQQGATLLWQEDLFEWLNQKFP
jgi:pimeloyl-ACP methyl ester carboxylesterase